VKTVPQKKTPVAQASGSFLLDVEACNYGCAAAMFALLPRRRWIFVQPHNNGPDKVYSRNDAKNMSCGAMIVTFIRTIPKTNIQIGKRLRRSVFFKLKYGKPLTINAAKP
jgi:hypothetical protein